jgi:hypothetical protein
MEQPKGHQQRHEDKDEDNKDNKNRSFLNATTAILTCLTLAEAFLLYISPHSLIAMKYPITHQPSQVLAGFSSSYVANLNKSEMNSVFMFMLSVTDQVTHMP